MSINSCARDRIYSLVNRDGWWVEVILNFCKLGPVQIASSIIPKLVLPTNSYTTLTEAEESFPGIIAQVQRSPIHHRRVHPIQTATMARLNYILQRQLVEKISVVSPYRHPSRPDLEDLRGSTLLKLMVGAVFSRCFTT